MRRLRSFFPALGMCYFIRIQTVEFAGLAKQGHLRAGFGLQVWQPKGVEGVYRFLMRAWRLVSSGVSQEEPSRDQLRLVHATIKRVRMLCTLSPCSQPPAFPSLLDSCALEMLPNSHVSQEQVAQQHS